MSLTCCPAPVSCLKIPWEKVEGYCYGLVVPTPCWPGLSSGYTIHGATLASCHQPDLEGGNKVSCGAAPKESGHRTLSFGQKEKWAQVSRILANGREGTCLYLTYTELKLPGWDRTGTAVSLTRDSSAYFSIASYNNRSAQHLF